MRTVLVAVLLLAGTARGDRAVTADGQLVEGGMRIDGEDVVVARSSGKEDRYPRRDFHLVETEDGKLIWSPGFRERIRGYEYLAREAKRDRLVDLLEQALKARAVALSRRLLDRAEAMGFTGKDAEKVKRRLERLEKKDPTPDRERANAVEARLPEILALHTDLLLRRARAAEGDATLRLLREVLRLDPKHKEALALLAERAPKDFPAGDARFWLDWHLDLAATGATLAGDEREMFLARKRWRPDVYGVLAGPIRVITPVKDTRTVSRCIAYGRITARALAEIFRTDQPLKRVAERMTVFLFESREEYQSKSGTGRVIENHEFLKWTAGHYSPAEQVSRVYWHTDRDAERRIARTFVHELTHHWLQEMNPRYADSELRRGRGPGYWIVEGFATLMQEGRYDLQKDRWSLFDSRSRSLDVVASLAKSGTLLPWASVYESDYARFIALPRDKNDVEVVRRWAVGKRNRSVSRLFYDQAGATCQFLYHADGGRHRDRLTAYVVAQYTGRNDRMPIDAAFGMTPEALGKRVEAFALEVARGWRPNAAK